MRMYAHDYIWGVQDRRTHLGPSFGLIDAALWLHRRLRRAGTPRPGPVVVHPHDPPEVGQLPEGTSGPPPVVLTLSTSLMHRDAGRPSSDDLGR